MGRTRRRKGCFKYIIAIALVSGVIGYAIARLPQPTLRDAVQWAEGALHDVNVAPVPSAPDTPPTSSPPTTAVFTRPIEVFFAPTAPGTSGGIDDALAAHITRAQRSVF